MSNRKNERNNVSLSKCVFDKKKNYINKRRAVEYLNVRLVVVPAYRIYSVRIHEVHNIGFKYNTAIAKGGVVDTNTHGTKLENTLKILFVPGTRYHQ